ncbi:hypothetical protein M752DRAFT_284523 [Aspergillus phoenicis ATCC 13157]|uniref:C2H2-type domain-containing protein n=1 Tax=Aspergillus phoenicis ATCC 13157 TaxID=1353007 RepID=A0A370PFP7_ASPPH|nr:hypothetical protein M752DRAFT_284523 [Aspergillus phoenicis ATCC 13157]
MYGSQPFSRIICNLYCRVNAIKPSADPKWEDAEEALQQATPNDMHLFLNFCLKLQYNPDGRRLKRFKKSSAITADWKHFRVYYARVTKHEMSKEMDKQGLDKQPRENIPVYIEDMVPFNETVLQRGLFTINRKQAMLSLQFKHLQLSLQRDPHGGPPVPMIELQPEFVKSVLGMSKLNTFALPEIIYGVSLVFSPHVLLFSILFYAHAFAAPDLKSMEDLRRLLETPMNGKTLDAELRNLSEIHGFLNPFFSHQFRYGGGALLDQSGFISDAQRNVIMAHSSSKTFINHYRPRRHAGRWIDKRRPRYLTEADRASVEKDPVLQAAIRWQVDLEIQRDRSDDSTLDTLLEGQKRKVHNLRRSLQEKQRKEIRRDFSRKQAFVMPPEQILLNETFFTWPTSDLLEDEWMWRSKAVAAAVQYCSFPEGGPLRGRPKHPAPSDDEDHIARPPARRQKTEERPTISAWEKEFTALDEHIKKEIKPQVCFQCRKKYSDHYGLRKHFKMSHLQDRKCNFLLLDTSMGIHGEKALFCRSRIDFNKALSSFEQNYLGAWFALLPTKFTLFLGPCSKELICSLTNDPLYAS